MNLAERPYMVTRPETLTQGSVQFLFKWLAAYVNLVVPDHAVEAWSDTTSSNLNPYSSLAEVVHQFGGNFEVSCSVSHVKDDVPQVRVHLLDGARCVSLGWARVRGSSSQVHAVAAAVSYALEQVFSHGQQPVIVDLANEIAADMCRAPARSAAGGQSQDQLSLSLQRLTQGGWQCCLKVHPAGREHTFSLSSSGMFARSEFAAYAHDAALVAQLFGLKLSTVIDASAKRRDPVPAGAGEAMAFAAV